MEKSIKKTKRKELEGAILDEPAAKRPKRSPPLHADRIMVRARGFEDIYNESIPLKELGRLIERHKYSYFKGLYYSSDLIKKSSVRGVGKLSYQQALMSLDSELGNP